MGVASVLVGLLAFVLAILSAFFVAVPRLGVALSIFALVMSVTSIVLGGVGMSQADDKRESNALPLTGLIIGIISFLVSFVLAMTCGSCNACLTFVDSLDAGVRMSPPPMPIDPDAGVSQKPPLPADDAGKPTGAPPTPIAPLGDGGPVPPPPMYPPPPMHMRVP